MINFFFFVQTFWIFEFVGILVGFNRINCIVTLLKGSSWADGQIFGQIYGQIF